MKKYLTPALLALALVATTARADVSFGPVIQNARDALGNPIANGTAVLILDLDGDGWGLTAYTDQAIDGDNYSSWLWDADDVLLARAPIGDVFPGLTQPFGSFALTSEYDANLDRWYVLTFDVPYDLSATGPGKGVAYGVLDMGVVPSDGQTLTPFVSAGAANLVTLPEPASAALLALLSGALLCRRDRRSVVC